MRRSQTDHWGELLRLIWRRHPWLTFCTMVTAIAGGLASVASHLWFTAGGNVEPVAFAALLGFLIFGISSLRLMDATTLTACILAPPFRKLFYKVLLPDLKRRGKCVVIITHDDQYFESA
jgi:hypothetical protein